VPNPLADESNAEVPLTADQLAERQGVHPVTSVDDLQVDIWKDDAEVDAFIEDVRRARQANVA
jgi:hypothetical protein